MDVNGIELGLIVGAIPTAAMIIASYAFSNITVNKYIEASIQNFAGGLILAAVASELFPLMLENVSEADTWIGVTVGFFVALITLNGLEQLIDYLVLMNETSSNPHTIDITPTSATTTAMTIGTTTTSNGTTTTTMNGSAHTSFKHPYQKIEHPMTQIISKLDLDESKSLSEVPEFKGLYQKSFSDMADWEDGPVLQASIAMNKPNHRQHLNIHIQEVIDTIHDMEIKCNSLISEPGTPRRSENLAEQIDEQTHILQYKLDHCRRLLQGSEAEIAGADFNGSWVTEEKKKSLQKTLKLLKLTGEHLMEHLQEVDINTDTIKEMYQHMKDMDFVINNFHQEVERVGTIWIRRNREMPEPELGAQLPVALIVPVTMDCFADGFLIGVSCALSPAAGIVLGAANCLEMGFLGMAYSVRLQKCTGSSFIARQIALFSPPILMFLSSGLGAYVAYEARDTPAIFVAFVAFGTVALLNLVCSELLIEANETLGEDRTWYTAISLYAAVYLVLMTARIF